MKIHFLYDALGSGSIDKKYLARLKEAGVEIAEYNPLRWYTLAQMNNRTHRKLMVVDGRIGFTGGAGVQDQWTGNAQDPAHWRDTHFRIEGPAVAQMQATFMENWIETTGAVLHGDGYFPKLEPAGPQLAQVVLSSPGGGGESVRSGMPGVSGSMRPIRAAASRRSVGPESDPPSPRVGGATSRTPPLPPRSSPPASFWNRITA